MPYKSEVLKRFIQTILNQLPRYIEAYSVEEQVLLDYLLSILNKYQLADYKRDELSIILVENRNTFYNHPRYIQLPFLWFFVDFLRMANATLNTSTFHATDFYSFLLKGLRGEKGVLGIFKLLKKSTPLNELSWEALQYECNKLDIPLNQEELTLVKALYKLTYSSNLHNLSQSYLKSYLAGYGKKSSRLRSFTNFFDLLELNCFLNYNPRAFGLSQVIFKGNLPPDKVAWTEIVNIQNTQNTTLLNSNMYLTNDNKSCIGILIIPSNTLKKLQGFLNTKTDLGLLENFETEEIKQSYYSGSLEYYNADQGWDYPQIISRTKKRGEREALSSENSNFFITPPFNSKWTFQDYYQPAELITSLCELTQEIPLSKLLVSDKIILERFNFLDPTIKNQVLNLVISSTLLRSDFSLDYYWIRISKIEQEELSQLLRGFPLCKIYESKDSFHIWTQFTPEIAEIIRKEWNGEIYNTKTQYQPQNLRQEWFNKEELAWKIPVDLLRQ
ncbi:MAG: hypothetical protein EAX86_01265 [Candidatus Heimdallarchaeota archaeon]|nr:hypothetical protein [Candidatus Heimdallarchaeota archaeon]